MTSPAPNVDAGTREFLDAMMSGPRPDPDTLTMSQFRAGMSVLRRWDYEPEPMRRIQATAIPSQQGELKARIYEPEADPPAGVLVWAHGGSWVRGDLDSHENLLRFVASRSGWTVVSVDYRLAPEHAFPAALEDVIAAASWAASSRGALATTSAILAVGGDSSGANLAAAAAHHLSASGEPKTLDLQVLLVPVLDATFSSRSWQELGDGRYLLTRGQLEWALARYAPDVPREDARLSPLLASTIPALPSAIIVCGELDPARDDARRYAKRLSDEGVRVEFSEHPGMVHHAVLAPSAAKAGLIAVEEMTSSMKRIAEGR